MAAKIFLNQPAQTNVCSATIVCFVLFSSGYHLSYPVRIEGCFFKILFPDMVPQMETINDFVTFEPHGVVRIVQRWEKCIYFMAQTVLSK